MIELLNVMSSKLLISARWESIPEKDHSVNIFFPIHIFLYLSLSKAVVWPNMEILCPRKNAVREHLVSFPLF